MRTQDLILFSCISLLPYACFADDHSLTPVNAERVKITQQTISKDLIAGNTQHAKSVLEQAMNNFHAVQLELGMVQTLMQAGEYRHALSAAAHTQAEHPDAIDSTLLYAWLLAVGGQVRPATQLLKATLQTQPNNEALLQLVTQIKQNHLDSQALSASIIGNDIQLYPYSEVNSRTHVLKHISNGVVIGNGTQVIIALPVEASSLNPNSSIWVRNGLGKLVRAEWQQSFSEQNLAILKLAEQLSSVSAKVAQTSLFPGTPIYLSEYRLTQPEQADWPVIKTDILGMPNESNGYNIHLKETYAGSSIYNPEGELIGLTTISASKISVIPLSDLVSNIQGLLQSKANKPTKTTNPLLNKKLVDELYEETLNTNVQVLIE